MATANVKAVITAEDRASKVVQGFGGSFGKLAGAFAVGNIAAQAFTRAMQEVVAVTKLGIKTSADLESARQGFITLVGSADKADAILKRIKEDAKKTPFELVGLVQANQLLTSVTKNADRSEDFLLNIGKALAAMGKGQGELDRVIINLQQIGATGRATMLDIRQFAFAGIPIFDMLQKKTGLTGEALDDFISNGKVTFELLEEMFEQAGAKGGQFADAFTNQAGTFNQQMSNMRDAIAIAASDFVKQIGLFDGIKNAMANVIPLIESINARLPALIQALKDPGVQLFLQALKEIAIVLGTVLAIGLFVATMATKNIIKTFVEMLNIMAQIRSAAQPWIDFINGGIRELLNLIQRLIDKFKELRNVTSVDVGKGLISSIKGIFGREHGGPVTGGRPFLVGERGPELFVPPSSGKIVPNNQMGGGSPINITIQAGAFTGSRADGRRFAEMIIEDLKSLANKKNQSVSQMLGM